MGFHRTQITASESSQNVIAIKVMRTIHRMIRVLVAGLRLTAAAIVCSFCSCALKASSMSSGHGGCWGVGFNVVIETPVLAIGIVDGNHGWSQCVAEQIGLTP